MVLSKSNESNTGYDTVDFMGAPVRTHVMRFSEEVQQYIIQQLTDLYSDPVTATVRETVSNALDATALAISRGLKPDPVEVYAPSMFDHVFKVVDHGVGMTAEQLDEFFSDYGNSSKITDMSAIGSKGLGAKAPLAYTQTFNVETVHDGRRIIISLNRGANANETKTLVDESTDEPNGTIVTIPVRREDVDSFIDAVKVYEKYSTPDLPIVVDGRERSLADRYVRLGDIQIAVTEDGEPVTGGVWAYRGEDGQKLYSTVSSWISDVSWRYGNVAGSTAVTLGGWRYDISSSGYRYNSDWDPSFVVELKPGVVDFPASRDEIKVNDRLSEFISYVDKALQYKKENGSLADAAKVWGSVSSKADRMAVLNAMVNAMDSSTAGKWTGLLPLLSMWPAEAAMFKVSDRVRKFKNVVQFSWEHSRSGKRIMHTMVAMSRSLGRLGSDGSVYVNWEWSAPVSATEFSAALTSGSLETVGTALRATMTVKTLEKVMTGHVDDGQAVSDAKTERKTLTTLLSPSVNWMKANPRLSGTRRGYDSRGYNGLVVVADKDYSEYGKKLNALRAYSRLCAGPGHHYGQLYVYMFDGDLSDRDAKDLEKAAVDAGVEWLGVMDWEAVAAAVKAKRAELNPGDKSSKGSPAARRIGSTVGAIKISTKGMDRWEAIETVMKTRFDPRTILKKTDLSNAVSSNALVYITDDKGADVTERHFSLLQWLASIKDLAGRDVYVVDAGACNVPANSLKPVAGYKGATVGIEDIRLASLKTIEGLARVKIPTRLDEQVKNVMKALAAIGDDRADAYLMKIVQLYVRRNYAYGWSVASASKTMRARIDAIDERWGVDDDAFQSVMTMHRVDADVPAILKEMDQTEFTEAASRLLEDIRKLDAQVKAGRLDDFAGQVINVALRYMYKFSESARAARDGDPAIKFISDWVDGLIALPDVQID